eukprot:SAG11_NODE_13_length_26388_cov_67.360341_21_plen_73_part_00
MMLGELGIKLSKENLKMDAKALLKRVKQVHWTHRQQSSHVALFGHQAGGQSDGRALVAICIGSRTSSYLLTP